MALLTNDVYNIYEKLEYNFLYNNDINSIHILLNLYDIEDNIKNIHPKYISLPKLKRHFSRVLKDKVGKDLINLNLGQLIHEDVNRLELYIYIEGYKKGYSRKYWVDKLEKETINSRCINDLCNRKYLYHFDFTEDRIRKTRECIDADIDRSEEEYSTIGNLVRNYCNNLIKPKIRDLNSYLDKQMIINYMDNGYNINEDDSFLNMEDLNYIYDEVEKIIFRECLKLYKESYWYGLNDRVLKRYR